MKQHLLKVFGFISLLAGLLSPSVAHAWQSNGEVRGIFANREWVGHDSLEGYTQFNLYGYFGGQRSLDDATVTLALQGQTAIAGEPAWRPFVNLNWQTSASMFALGSLTPLSLHPSVFDPQRNWPNFEAQQQPVWHEGFELGLNGDQWRWHTQLLWRATERIDRAEYFDVLSQGSWQITNKLSLYGEAHVAHEGGQLTLSSDSLRAHTLAAGLTIRPRYGLRLDALAVSSDVDGQVGYGSEFSAQHQLGKHQLKSTIYLGNQFGGIASLQTYQATNWYGLAWHWQVNPSLSFSSEIQMVDGILLTSQLIYWQINL